MATEQFRQGGGSRPDVLLLEHAGEFAVLKDQNQCDKLFAILVGPLLCWRECKALSKLQALDITPQLLARPDARSFVMSYHAAKQINRCQLSDAEWRTFVERLRAGIAAMHDAGVTHNDLRNPSNILRDANGQPVLVDLVACFCRGQRWNLANRWLFTKFCGVDYSAITKLKQRFAAFLLDDSDVQAEQVAGRVGMLARGFGQAVRKLSRRLFTG